MKKIDLEEILGKYCDIIAEDVIEIGVISFVNERTVDIIKAMKEACRQTLELASENAVAYYFTDKYSNGKPTNSVEAIVDKQSILNTINQIE